MRHHVTGGLDFVDQTSRLQPLDDLLARHKAIEAVQRQRCFKLRRRLHAVEKRRVVVEVEPALLIEHIDQRQIMPPANLEIVEVMRRRDLHGAGALFRIRIGVGNDRNTAADQRQDRGLADQVLQPLVVGMHRDRDVAQHGLGPRRRHDDEFVAAFDRISDVPEAALGLDLHHLEIGNGGLEFRVPVDQPLVLVDQAVAVQRDEHFHDRARQAFVHGEALARPVAGRAEPLELADDGAAGFRLPVPHPLDEGLAAHRPARRLLMLHQLALDHRLGGDAGVIGARLPQHVTPSHALEPAQDVLQRVVQRVAHVQRAGHVGRRDDDAEGRRAGPLRAAGTECAGGFPRGVNAAFHCARLIALLDHCGFAFMDLRGRKPAPHMVSTPAAAPRLQPRAEPTCRCPRRPPCQSRAAPRPGRSSCLRSRASPARPRCG